MVKTIQLVGISHHRIGQMYGAVLLAAGSVTVQANTSVIDGIS